MFQIGTVVIGLPDNNDVDDKFIKECNQRRFDLMQKYGFDEYSDENWKDFKIQYELVGGNWNKK
jgi:hypothetical protein